MKKRMLKTALAITVIAVTVFMLGCAKSKPSATTIQTTTVQRGNITVSSTSAGNLDFTRTENVAFDMAGTVTAVNVKVGDSVKAGEVLATLDATAFQDQITALERTLTAKQQAVIQSEISLKNTQIALDKMTGSVNSTDVETAQAKVDSAVANLQYALNNAAVASQDAQDAWQRAITLAQAELKSAENVLNALLTDADSDQVVIARMQVEIAVSQLQSAQNAVIDAQHALDEANKGSPEAKTSFDGIVTIVNVTGGAQIQKGQIAATIADPTQFQVVVPVGEKDALTLQLGGSATVSVNAITGVTLPAKIIAIAPTASVQSGVVNYQVTVQITSFVSVSGLSTFTVGAQSGNQTRQSQIPRSSPAPGQNQSEQANNGQSPFPVVAQPVTVKQGLSVIVSLVTASKNNVLMVPNRAIVRQSGKTYVNLRKDNLDTQVSVTTGISNTQFTEITSGLNEGDTIIITSSVTTSSATRTPGGSGIRIFEGG